MPAWLHALTLVIAVAGLGAFVLLADAFVRDAGRWLGRFAAVALLTLFALSFRLDLAGVEPAGVYVADAWSTFLQRMHLVAAFLGVLGSLGWLETRVPRRRAEYLALLLFTTAGAMLLAGARDWILLVVAFELMGVPLYVLAAYAKSDGRGDEPRLAAEAGLKLFVTGAASTALTLLGLAFVVGTTGTTRLAPLSSAPLDPITIAGMFLVIGGLGFKIGAVPFHMWVPDTYQGAPTPFVAYLSVAPKVAGLSAFAIVLAVAWRAHAATWGSALAAMAAASMLVGNVFALRQTDLRRLLAFSGVAQMGYALLGVCARSEQGLAMALFFLASYVVTNLGAFLVVHAAADSAGGHDLARLAGLSRRSPWLGGALLVFLLSLAGIPFVVGFWAKVFVLLSAWRAGLVVLVALGAVLTVVALFYYLSVARSTYMADGRDAAPVRVDGALVLAILACLFAVVGLGLWPGPLVAAATHAAQALLGTP